MTSSLKLAALGLAAAGALRAETTFFQARVAPIMERHCVVCHGPEKQKGKLRLDSFEAMQQGGDSGPSLKPGDAKGSELYRRIMLPADDDEVMPSDGKPLLAANEKKLIELWIAAGASKTAPLSDFAGAPPLVSGKAAPAVALAPDWRPRAAEIAQLETTLGVRLRPRSQNPTDGLVLRTASSPRRATDAALAQLAPVADLIVEAELARTPVTDAGLKAVGAFANLRSLDLTRTKTSSAGLAALQGLRHLEALNLTETDIDAAGVAAVKTMPSLQRLALFGSKAEPAAAVVAAPGAGGQP